MKKYIKIYLVLMMLITNLITLQGCSNEKLVIGYTIYPIGYILERIAGNYINTVNLSGINAPIQLAPITSNYEKVIDNINLILKIGNLEPYWNIYENDIKASKAEIIDLSGLSAISDFKRYTVGTISGSNVIVQTDWYEGGSFSLIDTYEKELGLWQDPIAMASMARTILDWILEKDPTNSSYYNNNFKQLEEDLVRLDSEYSSLNDKGLKLVTVTPSFGSWQKSYNVAVYPLILSKYGAFPTSNQLKIIEDRIKKDEVKYIAKESNMTEAMQALYEKVKADCNLTEINISNLSTLTTAEYDQNKNYLTLMYENLNNIESLLNKATEVTVDEENNDEELQEGLNE